MAERVSAVEDYLTCAVCLDTFKEPVTLGCNHSFCRSCLQAHWDQAKTRTCPVCRRRSSKENLVVNFALRELSVSVKSERTAGLCSSHPMVPSLFCLDEARALCPVCEFSQHKEHTVVSVEQATTELKQQLHTELQNLLKHRGELQSLEQLYKDIVQHSEKQAHLCEAHIRAQFTRLHRFLQEEEELRLKALREEQSRQAQTVSPELGRIRETLASVERSIQELQTQLQTTAEDFIHCYKPAQTSSPQPQTSSPQILPQTHTYRPQPLPQPGPGLLLNQAKVLGNLVFRVWKKMGKMVQFSPVVLDPNTAHPQLLLSEDLTCVRPAEPPVELPENPERFSERIFVLGSEGFSFGTHAWDVEVGDHPRWAVGVAKESVDRKRSHMPQNGFWCLGCFDNKYGTAHGPVNLRKPPQKVRVQLDCGAGTVSFYDPTDMSLIYTYQSSFTEKLFPVFRVGLSNADCQSKDIRICPEPAQDQL